MLLSIRGWGRAEFEAASPEFIEAARFALFAEKIAPLLDQAKAAQDTPIPKEASGSARLALARAKKDAAALVPILTSLIYPEDDDLG